MEVYGGMQRQGNSSSPGMDQEEGEDNEAQEIGNNR
jgi:hypothetical protein